MGRESGPFDGQMLNAERVSVPGDSGSFVFNSEGEVSGLLYGQFSGERDGTFYAEAGLVTSMDEVVASIKVKTGGDLALP